MRKSIIAIAAIAALVSCRSLIEEWQPVVTFSQPDKVAFVPADMDDEVNTTIADLKALYKEHGKPVVITGTKILKAQVVSSDEDGNIYRELYIQDATGGICLKLGRSSSYDDYKLGQILYVDCEDLCIGEYGYKSGNYGGGGLLQLGLLGDGWQEYLDGETKEVPEYETSYIDLAPIIAKHIFRGEILDEEERIKPATPSGSELSGDAFKNGLAPAAVGKLTKLTGLQIKKEVFALLYPDSNLNHDKNNSWNRLFISDDDPYTFEKPYEGYPQYPHNLIHWGLTKRRTVDHLESGDWDNLKLGDSGADIKNNNTVGTRRVDAKNFGYGYIAAEPETYDDAETYRQVLIRNATAQSVSHYFTYDGAEVQIRTSGYSRFADIPIPADVLDGSKKIDVIGIMSRYQGAAQFMLLDVFYEGNSTSLIKDVY